MRTAWRKKSGALRRRSTTAISLHVFATAAADETEAGKRRAKDRQKLSAFVSFDDARYLKFEAFWLGDRRISVPRPFFTSPHCEAFAVKFFDNIILVRRALSGEPEQKSGAGRRRMMAGEPVGNLYTSSRRRRRMPTRPRLARAAPRIARLAGS